MRCYPVSSIVSFHSPFIPRRTVYILSHFFSFFFHAPTLCARSRKYRENCGRARERRAPDVLLTRVLEILCEIRRKRGQQEKRWTPRSLAPPRAIVNTDIENARFVQYAKKKIENEGFEGRKSYYEVFRPIRAREDRKKKQQIAREGKS